MSVIKATVLLVEDSPSLATVYQSYLRGSGYRVSHVTTGAAAQEYLAGTLPDTLLLDLKLPDMSGMELLRDVHSRQLPVEVIIITANGSIDSALEATRFGAYDYLVKPFDAKRLRVTLDNALEHQRLTRLVETYQESDRRQFQGFIGASLAMQAVYRIIESAAPSKATVFITGESGTGKEVCAQAIHDLSPRRSRPFIALNCAAIPRDLMESEIFGHVKGAFTGALNERRGAAAQADGGTLFLDEIGELSLDLQSKLLRFLQTGTFQRVGSSRVEQVDARIVCATNRDPLTEVREGRFREDLYYRLHVIPITLPPLRDRDDDIVTLAEHFLDSFAREEGKPVMALDTETRSVLLGHTWPGNVRELQNVIRNVVVLNTGDRLTVQMLPPLSENSVSLRVVASTAPAVSPIRDLDIKPLWQVEKDAIERAIALTDGNIPKAAALLEVSPSTIYRKRQAWQAGN